jgi:hypothetical protein
MAAGRTAGVVAGVFSIGAVAAAITVLNLPEAEGSPGPAGRAPPKARRSPAAGRSSASTTSR